MEGFAAAAAVDIYSDFWRRMDQHGNDDKEKSVVMPRVWCLYEAITTAETRTLDGKKRGLQTTPSRRRRG